MHVLVTDRRYPEEAVYEDIVADAGGTLTVLDGDDEDALQAACEGVEVQLAEGELNLGDLLADASADRFESADDLVLEVYNHLPTEAVGEPGQSEGEG